jgi:competence protein ComEC
MSGDFGVFAFLANFIVLPFVPLTMLFGFLTSVFGFVSRFVGLLPGIPTYLFLSWDLFVAEIISKLPFATIHIPYIPVFVLVLFYIVAGFFVYRFHMKNNTKRNPSMVEPYLGDDSIVRF